MSESEIIRHACGHSHEHDRLPREPTERADEVARRARHTCPACNRTARNARYAATRISPAERQARQEAARAAEHAAWERAVSESLAWPGSRQVARWIEQRMIKARISYERSDADSGSVYFAFYDSNGDFTGEIRIADHKAPAGGGFNVERQASGGNAEIDVNPHSGCPWREAVPRAQALIDEQETL